MFRQIAFATAVAMAWSVAQEAAWRCVRDLIFRMPTCEWLRAAEMLALANVTQPGPFSPRTIELGHYIGIRRQGMLVAMAGERMRLDGLTEISAVCVESAYRGHGLAGDLVRSLVSSIAARSEIAFLHVFSSNREAIRLYRKLGFSLRRRMYLAVLVRAEAG
jgi:predicted GNAT family acetyltransferase